MKSVHLPGKLELTPIHPNHQEILMTDLFKPLKFNSGSTMKNLFTLAPLTNLQSHDDGVMSEDDYRFLTLRAKGNFGF